ncbi:hypothetical protein NPIL_434202 [Nephila pilipes]|uniref:Uncharacterized protein n=1 Tax=Nephila pilipes TaxID=299642 RepID=A0A8X6P6F0_NEPPI|nr:hypothetical protein NPIL_434202 [Nephila pilipes]
MSDLEKNSIHWHCLSAGFSVVNGPHADAVESNSWSIFLIPDNEDTPGIISEEELRGSSLPVKNCDSSSPRIFRFL